MNLVTEENGFNLVTRLTLAIRRLVILWENPFRAAIFTGILFFEITTLVGIPWRLSDTPYFNYLADAFLHGQLNLRIVPTNVLDLTLYNDQYFLYWGPLPAILLMPIVALFGTGVSDVLQTVFVGSFNAGLFALLLLRATQRGLIDLNPLKRALFVLFFAVGTAHAPLIATGSVWHLSQLTATCFCLLAYLAAFTFEGPKAFFWTGCAVACILATRMSNIMIAIFLVWYLIHRHRHSKATQLLKNCLLGIAPFCVIAVLLLFYNAARFGNPFETGLTYHLMHPYFYEMHDKYGVLSVHHIPTNLYYDFIHYPFIALKKVNGFFVNGSLFLLSPLFFASIGALWKYRKEQISWFLLLTIFIGSLPALMIMPGSMNFGPRYLLDIAVPLLLLTALGLKHWPTWLISICTAVSILHYLIGSVLLTNAWS